MRFLGLRASSSDPETLPVPLRLPARLPDDPAVYHNAMKAVDLGSAARLDIAWPATLPPDSMIHSWRQVSPADKTSSKALNRALGCMTRYCLLSIAAAPPTQPAVMLRLRSVQQNIDTTGQGTDSPPEPVRATRIAARLASPADA